MERRTAVLWITTAIALVTSAAFLRSYHPDLPRDALRAKYANAESRFLSVDGMSVHYRNEGDGPVLLLLHSAGSSLHSWDGWVEALRHDFRTIRLDLPGFGLTGPHPEGDYRIERYVDFLRAFTAELDLSAYYVAGHGLGGQLAWNYALRHPQAVTKLVLLSASGYPRSATAAGPSDGLTNVPGVAWLAEVMTPRSTTVSTLEASFGDPALISSELVDRYHELSRYPGNRHAAIMRLRAAALERNGDPRNLEQPTLVIWGMDDRRVALADGRGFVDDIPNARLVTLPGAGHLVTEERPGQSARAALTFLRDRR